jgi:hypothetical protein
MTATEWLINELGYKDLVESEYPTLYMILEQAKEMDKQNLLSFGCIVAMKAHSGLSGWSIEQLYNETFEQ